MATKRIEKVVDADVWSIRRRGTDGIVLQIVYTSEGSKHYTTTILNVNLSFCAMERIGKQFHIIMDELLAQWHETKDAISGK